MRIRLMAAAVLMLGFSVTAHAADPSVEDMIKQLKPTSGAQLRDSSYAGIRFAVPPPGSAAGPSVAPATNKAPAAAPPETTQPGTGNILSLAVTFATGSAELEPGARTLLDRLGTALSSPDLMTFRFRIEGHTDSVGQPAVNQDLSERRAQAVAGYLAEKFGVNPARLVVVGFGAAQPVVQVPPQTPEPRNRRVQVVNLGA